MKIYEEIPVSEETLAWMQFIMKEYELETHDDVIKFCIGHKLIEDAKDGGE